MTSHPVCHWPGCTAIIVTGPITGSLYCSAHRRLDRRWRRRYSQPDLPQQPPLFPRDRRAA